MDLKELAKSRNAKNVFCNRLGIQIRDIAPGRAVVVKTVGPEDVNPLGIPHGGVYFSMADTACGTAMATHGYAAVTMDANYHFLKSAAVGDTLTAESLKCAPAAPSAYTMCGSPIRTEPCWGPVRLPSTGWTRS